MNRFVVISFGDLKNYDYHNFFIQIELEGNFVMPKSQKLDKFIQKEQQQAMG